MLTPGPCFLKSASAPHGIKLLNRHFLEHSSLQSSSPTSPEVARETFPPLCLPGSPGGSSRIHRLHRLPRRLRSASSLSCPCPLSHPGLPSVSLAFLLTPKSRHHAVFGFMAQCLSCSSPHHCSLCTLAPSHPPPAPPSFQLDAHTCPPCPPCPPRLPQGSRSTLSTLRASLCPSTSCLDSSSQSGSKKWACAR